VAAETFGMATSTANAMVFEIALVLLRFDHIASVILNAEHGGM
jgi:hypothetical protein